jgi:hypothetical protein
MEHDTESVRQDKINLFWTIYSIDKALSLRLGRAATIQDYDISVPITPYIFGNVEPWSTIYTLWIHHARIQGNVYEQLYSPKALNQPEEQRVIQARKLAADLQWTVMEPHKVCLTNLTCAFLLTAVAEGNRSRKIDPRRYYCCQGR